MPAVSSLFIYPVKGCAGTSLLEMRFDTRGPVGDRRWMVVDASGQFMTQRQHPKLARITPRLTSHGVRLEAPKMEPLEVTAEAQTSVEVAIWSYRGPALDQGPQARQWLSEVLGTDARLVRFDESTHRRVSREHTDLDAEVAFADGFPALLTSIESLGELNRRLEQPLPMNRFRPNIVVRDCHPFEEDTWARVDAPDLTLSVVKPCVRCVVTTIDQRTQRTSKEPLRTLASFRRHDSGVIFGQNCVHHQPGKIAVGDVLQVTPSLGARTSATPELRT